CTTIYCFMIAPPGILFIRPIFILMLHSMVGLVGCIPFMLLISKVQKFCALSICCIIVSLILAIIGHPWIALVFSVPIILISDGIMAWGHYKNWNQNCLGYILFSFWPIGTFIP